MSDRQKLLFKQGKPIDYGVKHVQNFNKELYKKCDELLVSRIRDVLKISQTVTQFNKKLFANDNQAWLFSFYYNFYRLKLDGIDEIQINSKLNIFKPP
jgi:hypothetical protein